MHGHRCVDTVQCHVDPGNAVRLHLKTQRHRATARGSASAGPRVRAGGCTRRPPINLPCPQDAPCSPAGDGFETQDGDRCNFSRGCETSTAERPTSRRASLAGVERRRHVGNPRCRAVELHDVTGAIRQIAPTGNASHPNISWRTSTAGSRGNGRPSCRHRSSAGPALPIRSTRTVSGVVSWRSSRPGGAIEWCLAISATS